MFINVDLLIGVWFNIIKFYNLTLFFIIILSFSILITFLGGNFVVEKKFFWGVHVKKKYLVISDYSGPKVYAKLVLKNAANNSQYSRRSFSIQRRKYLLSSPHAIQRNNCVIINCWHLQKCFHYKKYSLIKRNKII